MVKLSVILPIYNSEKYLKNTLDSIVNQTYTDFEVYCINDGSTDNSPNIIKEFSNEDVRIKSVSQKNQGPGHARNKGLEECGGEYVFFMDRDDYIVPTFFETLMENIETNDSDMSMFKIGTIQKNKKVKSKTLFPIDKYLKGVDFNNFTFSYKDIKTEVLNSSFAPWSKLYKKEFLDSHEDFLFDEHLAYEDVLFHVKTMLKASRISFVPKYLYYYRIDSDNSLTSDDDTHFDIFKVVDNVEEYLSENGHLEEFEKDFEMFKLAQITQHITIPVDDEYFKTAKTYLKGIDIADNDKLYPKLRKRLEVFYESNTSETYQKNIKVQILKEKHADLEKKNRKLKKENKKLKSKRDRQKNIKNQLENSNSWRMTKPLRNIANSFK